MEIALMDENQINMEVVLRRAHAFSVQTKSGIFKSVVYADSEMEAIARLKADDPVWHYTSVVYHGISEYEDQMPPWHGSGLRPAKRAIFHFEPAF